MDQAVLYSIVGEGEEGEDEESDSPEDEDEEPDTERRVGQKKPAE